jgi:hypothetical protein
MAVTRKMIKGLLRKLNEAENSRPNRTVEETIAAIDAVCTPDSQGRLNNQPFHDRETERQNERMLFTAIPDYHRTIGLTVIDPPFVAFEWKIEGTHNDAPIEVQGCSIVEINEKGLLRRGTVYLDTAQFPPLTE